MSNIIILGDTNVAYNLYFFISQDVIPEKNIIVGSDLFQFHPIVLEEVEAHTQAWITSKELGHNNDELPSFFDDIGKDRILKICKFVEDNLAQMDEVKTDTSDFMSQRKIYEQTRLALQKQMRSKSTVGNKVNSTPSINDYKILYSASKQNMKLSTNDRILLEISKAILDPQNAFKTEELLRLVLQADPNKRKGIEEALKTLNYFGRILNSSEIF
jgi:hypothetical protein